MTNDTPLSLQDLIKTLAIENLGILLSEKIKELNDEAATQILTRLSEFVDLIRQADQRYAEVMSLIVDDELEILDQLGYSYMKDSSGSIQFYSQDDISRSRDEPDRPLLTEADYYAAMELLAESYKTNGLPEKYNLPYSRLKETFQELMNCETRFGLAMEQARPYLNNIEGMFMITQYYANIQLLQSVITMLEA